MLLSDFDYHLPDELIAQHPPETRGGSRLLHVEGMKLTDLQFLDFLSLVHAGDVMVFNNTRVIKARLFGEKSTGGKIEALVERVLDTHTVLAHIRSSKSPKVGSQLIFAGQWHATMVERVGELFKLRFTEETSIFDILDASGKLPLPPYITRDTDNEDDTRYQTVYAKERGAVAAPTAGLHFTEAMLATLKEKGVELHFVTLHVGAGTFQPVRVENLDEHKMHSEIYEIPAETEAAIHKAKREGRQILAVGTTSMRALEAASQSGELKAGHGETDIFITPGYQFKVVDRLLTNFHLPKSTLLMLVSAFAGYDEIRHVYEHAVANQYHFFSYGDAMLLERKISA